MPNVNRMCFRRRCGGLKLPEHLLVVTALLTSRAWAGWVQEDGPEIRTIARTPGVVEVRLPGDGSPREVRTPGGARAPMRPDPQRAGWVIAHVDLGSDVIPGGGMRLEVWGQTRGTWAMQTPVFFQPEAPNSRDVPDWSKGVVWYQVFPERFRNGNPGNDPYAWDHTVLPWGAPFHEATLEEIELQWDRRTVDPRRYSADPDRWWGAVGQTIFERRYGGDLQGVVQELDALRELGVTALYFCPVFDARSLHKYEASDHRHVDPTLGDPDDLTPVDRSGESPDDPGTWNWEAGDRYLVDVLLPEAHKRGMRVVLDGVWNHVGRAHFAFSDVLEHGRGSPYADWFRLRFDEDGRVVWYDAWDRPNGGLPEFRQTPEGDLAPGPKAHVFAVTRRWMDPNGDGDPSDGIDGWRLDVAPEIGTKFWNSWRNYVRAINPDAVLIGEIWSDAERWFNGVAFDAQMNYPLAYPIVDWLAIARNGTDARACAERITAALQHDPRHDMAQMNLLASHDTERAGSLMFNDFPRQFDNGAQPWARGSRYDAGPIDGEAKGRLLAAYGLLMLLPGSPMIYNGDEWALPGADDPDDRRPIPWPDMPTPDEPDGAFRERVQELLAPRGHPWLRDVLRFGTVEVGAVPGADAVVVRRTLGARMVEGVVARTGEPAFPEAPDGWREVGSDGRKAPWRGGAGAVAWRVLEPDFVR